MVASPSVNGASDHVRCGVDVPTPVGSIGTNDVYSPPNAPTPPTCAS